MNRIILFFLSVFLLTNAGAQTLDSTIHYRNAFNELHRMLKEEVPLSFKRAVFVTENAYLDNNLRYEDFEKAIAELVRLTKIVAATDGLQYTMKDRQQVLLSASVYRMMKDTLVFDSPNKTSSWTKYPFTYDTADFRGEKNWTQMFVTKLLYTQTGNCHSLPALYKILTDELDVQAWLAITPNHTYIKQWSDKDGWYNTELTTGRFPYDAEIKINSYIKTETIASGVYMDTLSAKETIAYVMTDLAQGYAKKFGHADIHTPIKWLETALEFYPDFPNALILRAELYKKQYVDLISVMSSQGGTSMRRLWNDQALIEKFTNLEEMYFQIHQVGYRRMPKEMYLNWLYRIKKDTTRSPYYFKSPQPFKDYNYDVQVVTAGDGQNYEFFDQEETTQIGTVILNRITGKITSFVEYGEEEIPDNIISRMYDPALGRFWQVDPASHEYYSVSPYAFVVNNPVNAIDPDGRRVYFVAGAGNDQIGWNYVAKWQRAFDNGGIQGFTRLNASHDNPADLRNGDAAMGDIMFTAFHRSSAFEAVPGTRGMEERFVKDDQIDNAVGQIQKDLAANPLAEGEQFNLAGYSYGSVLQAHAALKLANSGQKIDNLILIGSPISDKSALYKQLTSNKNIGKVLRIDIRNDLLSNPQDILDFIKGAKQNKDPKNVGEGPHFDLARPGTGKGDNNDTYKRIQQVAVEWLKQQGVK